MQIVNSIFDFIEKKNFKVEELTNYAIALGLLWGQQIQKIAGWQWRILKSDGNENFALISMKREYFLLPIEKVFQIFLSPQANNLALLFNMIKAGKLPKSEENNYLKLS